MSINIVAVSGNVTNEPELRSTSSGMAILDFGIAVNERRKNAKTGEWEDVPNYFDCTFFGKRAESISRFIRKGTYVVVGGHLRWSSWQNNDGQRRSKVSIIVDDVEFRNKERGQQTGQSIGGVSLPAGTSVESVYDDEDIPF